MTFVKITEQPSSHGDLDKMSVRELLEGINDEDARVAPAVRRTIPQLEKLVTAVVERMRRGGRIFYLGAGTSGRARVLDASEIPPTFGMPPSLVVGLIAGGDRRCAIRSSSPRTTRSAVGRSCASGACRRSIR